MSDSHEAATSPEGDSVASSSAADQHPVLVYTTWRLAIFIVVLVALYLVGPGSGAVNGAALSIDGGWLAA